MQNINDLRNEIDRIDDEVLKRLNERMNFVRKIGELKQTSGSSPRGARLRVFEQGRDRGDLS